jgi:hypothetical protein
MTATEYVAITGLCVAAYGAVLSTVNSISQFIAYRRDRADVVLQVRRNMGELRSGPNPFDPQKKMTFTLITAVNRGKRPVTIQSFAMKLLDTSMESWLTDVRPRTPREITEGQSVTAYVDETNEELKYVECFYVWDSVGRQFRFDVAPWYRRLLSRFRRQFNPTDRS